MANALLDWLQAAKDRLNAAGSNMLAQQYARQNPQSVMPEVNMLLAREALAKDPAAVLRGITADSAMADPYIGGWVGPAAIKAWHGSPHVFSKWERGKVGTGQGAASYGHGEGGYHAEEAAVAKAHQDPEGIYARLNSGMNNRQEFAHDLLSQGRSPDDVFKAMKMKYGQWMSDADIRADLDPMVKARGNLYEESLRWPDPAREAADPLGPQHFLQWDKPLSEQPAAVKKAIDAHEFGIRDMAYDRYGNHDPTGAQLYMTMAQTRPFQPAAEASNYLLKQGVPGIRYLDAGSRDAGQGSSNYVVFDPSFVEILSRNGIPVK